MGLALDYDHGQTPLDQDEIDGLLISSVTTKRDLDEQEQLNIQSAFERYLFSNRIKSAQILKVEFILEVHLRMFDRVWSWAGEFRTTEKSIGITWTQIPVALRILIDDCGYWIDHQVYSPEEIAIRFKHRLVSIHLFSNGNGRHSRLIADILMKHVFQGSKFSWGQRNLANKTLARKNYIQALKQADLGNYEPLIKFALS